VIKLKKLFRFMSIIFFLSIVILSSSVFAGKGDHIYDRNGINKITGTKFNRYGFDENGFDKYGYNCHGFDCNEFDRNRYTKTGFDTNGMNRFTHTDRTPTGENIYGRTENGVEHIWQVCYIHSGYNDKGFNRDGVHKITKTKFDLDGLDRHGFDTERKHYLTGTRLSPQGFSYRGFYEIGDLTGFNEFTQSHLDDNGLNLYGEKEKQLSGGCSVA
jgi:hypothetical protein